MKLLLKSYCIYVTSLLLPFKLFVAVVVAAVTSRLCHMLDVDVLRFSFQEIYNYLLTYLSRKRTRLVCVAIVLPKHLPQV